MPLDDHNNDASLPSPEDQEKDEAVDASQFLDLTIGEETVQLGNDAYGLSSSGVLPDIQMSQEFPERKPPVGDPPSLQTMGDWKVELDKDGRPFPSVHPGMKGRSPNAPSDPSSILNEILGSVPKPEEDIYPENSLGSLDIEMKASDRSATIRIDGKIGQGGITAAHFARELESKAKGASRIDLIVNSRGGSLFDALYMYDELCKHSAEVYARGVGIVASAATLLMLTAKTANRTLAKGTNWMIHPVRPTQAQLEGTLDMVRNLDRLVLDIYKKGTGLSAEQLQSMLGEKDCHLSADKAMQHGFVGSVGADSTITPASQTISAEIGDWTFEDATSLINNISASLEIEAFKGETMDPFQKLLSEAVNKLVKGDVTKDKVVTLLANAASISPKSVKEILDGTRKKIKAETIKAFSGVEGFASEKSMIAAATQAKVEVTEAAKPAEGTKEGSKEGVKSPADKSDSKEGARAPADPVVKKETPAVAAVGADVPGFESYLMEVAGDSIQELTDDHRTAWLGRYNNSAVVPKPEGTPMPQAPERESRADQIRREMQIENFFGDFRDLAAKAMEEKWDQARMELELRLAISEKRISEFESSQDTDPGFGGGYAPAFHNSANPETEADNDKLVQIAFAMSLGVTETDLMDPAAGMSTEEQLQFNVLNMPRYSVEDVDRARRMYRNFGIQDLVRYCNRESHFKGEESIRNALEPQMGSFSTVRFPKFLEECIQRAIVANYRKVAPKWNRIASPMRVDDFKEHRLFRAFGTGNWEPVKCGDVIKHGSLSAAEIGSISVCTYAQMLSICHEHIIDGDLGTIQSFAEMMAMEGRLAPEISLWDTIRKDCCDDQYKFNFNDPDQLEKLYELFCQKISNGDPKDDSNPCGTKIALDLDANLLLVHKCDQMKLMRLLNGDPALCGTSADDGCHTHHVANMFRGMFDVCASSMFCPGGLALMTGPRIAPAYRIAFLNGVQAPRIERLRPDNNKLGIELRGTITYGVAPTEDFLKCTTKDLQEAQAAG